MNKERINKLLVQQANKEQKWCKKLKKKWSTQLRGLSHAEHYSCVT